MVIDELIQKVIDGDEEEVTRLTRKALESGLNPLKVLDEGLIKALGIIGEKFNVGEFFLADLMISADAAKAGIRLINPELKETNVTRKETGTVIIGTVEGDIHDIGKTIVALMLEIHGFKVYDLGVDVSTNEFMQKAKELKPDILGMSSLLSTTMVKQQEVIENLTKKGLKDKIKVIVGGAPVNQEWANEIGADGFAPDAILAVKKVQDLLNINN
jgi:5-methyltetrahydrofolate--homocysteine methyltransferase